MHIRSLCAFLHIGCDSIIAFGWSVPSKQRSASGLSECQQWHPDERSVCDGLRGSIGNVTAQQVLLCASSLGVTHACSPTPNTLLRTPRLHLSSLTREEHEKLHPHRCCPVCRPGRLRQGRAAEAGRSRTGTCRGPRTGTGAGPGPRARCSTRRQRPGSRFPVCSTGGRPGPDAWRRCSQGRTEEVMCANPVHRGASKKPAAGLVFSLGHRKRCT